MGRRSQDGEFPLLNSIGLKVCDIRGDGNCLFSALSDQIYGHQDKHSEIRQTVVQFMRDNRSQFIKFVPVHEYRRNPKRKNTAAPSSSIGARAATEDEQNSAYDTYLASMARGGTYGGHLEIQAFSTSYNTDVKIYHFDWVSHVRALADDGAVKRPVAHVAYHVWEHYSSVRNIDGPFSGLPEVRERELSSEEVSQAQSNLPKKHAIQEWMVKSVMTSLPHLMDETLVRKTLQEFNGHVDNAVSKLLDAEYHNGSLPSSPGSSSVERELDSDDDDEIRGPNKRQNRRIKAARKAQTMKVFEKESSIPTFELTQPDTIVTPLDSALSPISSVTSHPSPIPSSKLSVVPRNTYKSKKTDDDDEGFAPLDNEDDDNYQPDEDDDDNASVYTSSSCAPSISVGSTIHRPTKIILNTKSRVNQNGPKRVTARERKGAKKAAQKQARKNTKRANAKHSSSLVPLASATSVQRNSPPMDSVIGMRTLYI